MYLKCLLRGYLHLPHSETLWSLVECRLIWGLSSYLYYMLKFLLAFWRRNFKEEMSPRPETYVTPIKRHVSFWLFREAYTRTEFYDTELFLKPLLITILRFRLTSWKIDLFAWWNLAFWLVERIIFKKNFSKTDLPFRFCKIGLRKTYYLFRAEKMVDCLFRCNFVRFWLTFLKKSFLKGKICSLESEIRGVHSILIIILRLINRLPEKIEFVAW